MTSQRPARAADAVRPGPGRLAGPGEPGVGVGLEEWRTKEGMEHPEDTDPESGPAGRTGTSGCWSDGRSESSDRDSRKSSPPPPLDWWAKTGRDGTDRQDGMGRDGTGRDETDGVRRTAGTERNGAVRYETGQTEWTGRHGMRRDRQDMNDDGTGRERTGLVGM